MDTFAMDRRTQQRLARYQQRYAELAQQVGEIGFIKSGSIVKRKMTCGKASCGCHDDPPRLHGPYYQWSAKVGGKTVTRQLSPSEAHLHKTWIANDRKLSELIGKMRDLSSKAQELLIAEERQPRKGP